MALYYVLASGSSPLATTGHIEWPYDVSIAFDRSQRQICLREGMGGAATVNFLTATEALALMWASHFAKANAGWLLPFVLRMSEGASVQRDELLSIYMGRHGVEPSVFHASMDL